MLQRLDELEEELEREQAAAALLMRSPRGNTARPES